MPKESEADRSYTEWLHEKVSAARAGIADGTNKAYTEEEWAKIRQAIVRWKKDLKRLTNWNLSD